MKNINKILEELSVLKTKQIDNTRLSKFKGKRIMTFGTFDLLHIGHEKIIDNALSIAGHEDNLIIGVSSDNWNNLKGKTSHQNQQTRIKNLSKKYPKAIIILEDHSKPEESWGYLWDKYKIDLIVMGGDHINTLSYLNNLLTPNGNKMKIAFFERTPHISSTLLRDSLKTKK